MIANNLQAAGFVSISYGLGRLASPYLKGCADECGGKPLGGGAALQGEMDYGFNNVQELNGGQKTLTRTSNTTSLVLISMRLCETQIVSDKTRLHDKNQKNPLSTPTNYIHLTSAYHAFAATIHTYTQTYTDTTQNPNLNPLIHIK